jgi:hypothetical protein
VSAIADYGSALHAIARKNNHYLYVIAGYWRREWDSISGQAFRISNLLILRCRNCHMCQKCRCALPKIAQIGLSTICPQQHRKFDPAGSQIKVTEMKLHSWHVSGKNVGYDRLHRDGHCYFP